MSNMENLPIEVKVEVDLLKAKNEILQAINQIGTKYELPSTLIIMVVNEIVKDSRLNSYETIIKKFDINIPEGSTQQMAKPNSTSPQQSQPVKVSKSEAMAQLAQRKQAAKDIETGNA